MDSDSNNKINYSEFLGMLTEKKNLLTDLNLKTTFQTLDFDNNGSLSVQELKRAFEFGGNTKTDKFW
jgi:Ca2+-binding EF-hand superfamily protein